MIPLRGVLARDAQARTVQPAPSVAQARNVAPVAQPAQRYVAPAQQRNVAQTPAQQLIQRAVAARPSANYAAPAQQAPPAQSLRGQMSAPVAAQAITQPQNDPYGRMMASELQARSQRAQQSSLGVMNHGFDVPAPLMQTAADRVASAFGGRNDRPVDAVPRPGFSAGGSPLTITRTGGMPSIGVAQTLPDGERKDPQDFRPQQAGLPSKGDGDGGKGLLDWYLGSTVLGIPNQVVGDAIDFIGDTALPWWVDATRVPGQVVGEVADEIGGAIDWARDLSLQDVKDAPGRLGGNIRKVPGAAVDAISDSIDTTRLSAESVIGSIGSAVDAVAQYIPEVAEATTNPMGIIGLVQDGYDAITGPQKSEAAMWVMEQIARPQEFGASQVGTTFYEFATGNSVPGGVLISDVLGPVAQPLDGPTRSVYQLVYQALSATIPSFERGVQSVFDQGFSTQSYVDNANSIGISSPPPQFSGGRAVWEYSQSFADDLPWYLRYPLRIGTDSLTDPMAGLPAVAGVGKSAAGTGKILRAASGATKTEKAIGLALEGAGQTVRWSAEAPDVPFALVGKGLGFIGRRTGSYFGLTKLSQGAHRAEAYGLMEDFIDAREGAGQASVPLRGAQPGYGGSSLPPAGGPTNPTGGGGSTAPKSPKSPKSPQSPKSPSSSPSPASSTVNANGQTVSASGRTSAASGSGSGPRATSSQPPQPATAAPSVGSIPTVPSAVGDLLVRPGTQPRSRANMVEIRLQSTSEDSPSNVVEIFEEFDGRPFESGLAIRVGRTSDGREVRFDPWHDQIEMEHPSGGVRTFNRGGRLVGSASGWNTSTVQPSVRGTAANAVSQMRQGYASDGSPVSGANATAQEDRVVSMATAAAEDQANDKVGRIVARDHIPGTTRSPELEGQLSGAREIEMAETAGEILEGQFVGTVDEIRARLRTSRTSTVPTVHTDPVLADLSGTVEVVDGQLVDIETGMILDDDSLAGELISEISNPTPTQVAGANEAASYGQPDMPGHFNGGRTVTPEINSYGEIGSYAARRGPVDRGELSSKVIEMDLGADVEVTRFLNGVIERSSLDNRKFYNLLKKRSPGHYPHSPIYGGSRPLDRAVTRAIDEGDARFLERLAPIINKADIDFEGAQYRQHWMMAPGRVTDNRSDGPSLRHIPDYAQSVFGGREERLENVSRELMDALHLLHIKPDGSVGIDLYSPGVLKQQAYGMGKRLAEDAIELKMQVDLALRVSKVDGLLSDEILDDVHGWMMTVPQARLSVYDPRSRLRTLLLHDWLDDEAFERALVRDFREPMLRAAREHRMIRISEVPGAELPFAAEVGNSWYKDWKDQVLEIRSLLKQLESRPNRLVTNLEDPEASRVVTALDNRAAAPDDPPEVYDNIPDDAFGEPDWSEFPPVSGGSGEALSVEDRARRMNRGMFGEDGEQPLSPNVSNSVARASVGLPPLADESAQSAYQQWSGAQAARSAGKDPVPFDVNRRPRGVVEAPRGEGNLVRQPGTSDAEWQAFLDRMEAREQGATAAQEGAQPAVQKQPEQSHWEARVAKIEGGDLFEKNARLMYDSRTAIVAPVGVDGGLGPLAFTKELVERSGGTYEGIRSSSESRLNLVTGSQKARPKRIDSRLNDPKFFELGKTDPERFIQELMDGGLSRSRAKLIQRRAAEGKALPKVEVPGRGVVPQFRAKPILDLAIFRGDEVHPTTLWRELDEITSPATINELRALGIRTIVIPDLELRGGRAVERALRTLAGRYKDAGINVVVPPSWPDHVSSGVEYVTRRGTRMTYLPNRGTVRTSVNGNPKNWGSNVLVNPFVVSGMMQPGPMADARWGNWIRTTEDPEIFRAMELLDQIVKSDPSNLDARIARQAMYMTGDYTGFVQEFASEFAARAGSGAQGLRLKAELERMGTPIARRQGTSPQSVGGATPVYGGARPVDVEFTKVVDAGDVRRVEELSPSSGVRFGDGEDRFFSGGPKREEARESFDDWSGEWEFESNRIETGAYFGEGDDLTDVDWDVWSAANRDELEDAHQMTEVMGAQTRDREMERRIREIVQRDIQGEDAGQLYARWDELADALKRDLANGDPLEHQLDARWAEIDEVIEQIAQLERVDTPDLATGRIPESGKTRPKKVAKPGPWSGRGETMRVRGIANERDLRAEFGLRPALTIEDGIGQRYTFDYWNEEIRVEGVRGRLLTEDEARQATKELRRREDLRRRSATAETMEVVEGGLVEYAQTMGWELAVVPQDGPGITWRTDRIEIDEKGQPLPYGTTVELSRQGQQYKALAPMTNDPRDPFLLEDVTFQDVYEARSWSEQFGIPVQDRLGIYAYQPVETGWEGAAHPLEWSPIKHIMTPEQPNGGVPGMALDANGNPMPIGGGAQTSPGPAGGIAQQPSNPPRRYAPGGGAAPGHPGPATAGLKTSGRSKVRELGRKIEEAHFKHKYKVGDPPREPFKSSEMNDLFNMSGSEELARYGDRIVDYGTPDGSSTRPMFVWEAVDLAAYYSDRTGRSIHQELRTIALRAGDRAGEVRPHNRGVVRAEFNEARRDAVRRGEEAPSWDDLMPERATSEKVADTKLIKALDLYLGQLRTMRLGNVITGTPGAIGDTLGTAWQVMVSGKVMLGMGRLDAPFIWRVSRAWVKAGREARELNRLLYSQALLDTGMTYPSGVFRGAMSYIERGGGKTPILSLKNQKLGQLGYLASNAVAVQRILDYRAGLEYAARQSVWDRAYSDYLMDRSFKVLQKALADANGGDILRANQIFDQIQQAARSGGPLLKQVSDVEHGVFGREQGHTGLFSSGVVEGVTGDRKIAQLWQAELNKAADEALKYTDKVLFSYQSLALDETLRRMTIFHYWLSRATPYHLRQATRNPFLLNGYFQMWETIREDARRENMPAFLDGMFKVLQRENGVYAAISPLGFIVPAVLFDAYSQEGNVLESAQSLLNPLLAGAMGALGMTDYIADIAGTRPLERFLMNFANGLKGEGVPLDEIPLLGRFIDMNSMQLTMPIQDIIIQFVEAANGVLQKAGIAVGDYEPFDRGANEMSQIRTIGFALGEEIYGPIDTWTPEVYEQVLADITSVIDGTAHDSPFAQEIFSRYGQEGLYQALGSLVAAGGIVTRSENRDTYIAEAMKLFDGKGEKTQTQRNAALVMQLSKVTDPTWVVTNNQFYSLGTPQSQDAFSTYYKIMFANTDVGMVINGRIYSAQALKAMSDSARKTLADEWRDSTPGAAQLIQQQRSARETFLSQHPEYADYQTYHSSVLQMGAGKFVERMLQVSPNFKLAYEREKAQKAKYGATGLTLQREMELWAAGMPGYVASIGQPWELGDKIAPVYDPTNDPYANPFFADVMGQGAGGSSLSPSGGSSAAAEWRNGHLYKDMGVNTFKYPEQVSKDYQDNVAAYQVTNNILAQQYPGNWNPDTGEWYPWADDSWEKRDLGIPTSGIQYPTRGGTMRLFDTFMEVFPNATFNDFLWWNANQRGFGDGGGGLFQTLLSGNYSGTHLLSNFGGIE